MSFVVLVLETGITLCELSSESQNEDGNHLEDYAIWSSIVTSVSRWHDMKRKKAKLKSSRLTKRRRIKRDEEMVCYGSHGCFRDEGPFDYLDTLPAPPEEINTTFTLFTRDTPLHGGMLDYNNINTLRSSHFKSGKPVKIIIHGFGSSGRRPWVKQMTEALLFMEDLNVIIVDWEKGASLPNYVQAAANTRLVGKQIALLINIINFEKKLSGKDYHLIGFSLGAHIAGYTGMEIRNISRITGLDPASPLFEGYNEKVRLDPSDAEFVDVIHSNGNSFIRGGLGSFTPMGHVDFYPNGGREQVGCNSVFMGAITDLFHGKWHSLCHHRRAFRFFIDSVVPTCKFQAFACDNYTHFLRGECFDCGKDGKQCANMGYFAYKSAGRGQMYLVTRDSEPFCANQYKIRILNRLGQGSTWGKLEITFFSRDANETFQLTSESDEIKDIEIIQGLVVAHPILRNITHIVVKYTKYRGWIYSGKDFWALDKITLTHSNGDTVSYCGYSTVLEDNIPLKLNLTPGNCTLAIPSPALPNARLARLIWKVVSDPIRGQRPQLMWSITLSTQDAQNLNEDSTYLLQKL